MFITNENEKVRKYRIYRALYALNEKTKVYAREQWNKFAMVCYMWYLEFKGVQTMWWLHSGTDFVEKWVKDAFHDFDNIPNLLAHLLGGK